MVYGLWNVKCLYSKHMDVIEERAGLFFTDTCQHLLSTTQTMKNYSQFSREDSREGDLSEGKFAVGVYLE